MLTTTLLVTVALTAVAVAVIVELGSRKRTRLFEQFCRDQAQVIRAFYLPVLEHQAQRDPEFVVNCELMIADLKGRARVMELVGEGRPYGAVVRQVRSEGFDPESEV